MSIFFTPDDQPCCRFCGQLLPGYAQSGHCPHCGKWFSVDRATIGPSRIRAIALLARSTPAAFGLVPSIWTGLAAALFITINAAVVILLGRMAVRALYHSCGMTP